MKTKLVLVGIVSFLPLNVNAQNVLEDFYANNHTAVIAG